HDLIVRAWTEPGPFQYRGKHYQFNYVNPWPVPTQKPHPPIWIPSQGSFETIKWAAQKRYTYCQTLSPIGEVAKFFRAYREEAEKSGYQATIDQCAWSTTIYVAETDAIAKREAKDALESLTNVFLRQSVEQLVPPGYSSIDSMLKIRQVKTQVLTKPRSIDDMIAAGVVIIGSAATVREKLEEYQALAGFNTALVKTQFGTLSAELTKKNMEAFAAEVMPHLQAQERTKAAAE
ncbi:MAG: LLM class flavin-dependent oxidoreductase, partial [Rhodospirillales bacterium]